MQRACPERSGLSLAAKVGDDAAGSIFKGKRTVDLIYPALASRFYHFSMPKKEWNAG
jgi:hypothetical protein